jgi:hypothetical protein
MEVEWGRGLEGEGVRRVVVVEGGDNVPRRWEATMRVDERATLVSVS